MNMDNFIKKNQLWFWSFLSILLFLKFIFVTCLDRNNFLFTYQYFTPDSYRLLASGIRLFDSSNPTFHNFGFSFIINFLHTLNSLFLLVLVNHLIFLGIIFFVFKVSKLLTDNFYWSLLVVIFMFLNYNLQIFANYILTDYYAIFFLTVSLYLLISGKIELSFFLLGISGLFQNFALIISPIWFFYFYHKETRLENFIECFRPNRIINFIYRKISKLIFLFLLLLGFNLPWYLYKLMIFGNPFYSKVDQIHLLQPNLDSVFFYLINSYTMFGPIFFLVVYLLLFQQKIFFLDKKNILLALGFFITFLFWTVFYEWNDRRFLLYLIPFIYPLFALYLKKTFSKNLHLKFLAVILLLIYPTTISLGSFFNSNTIMITNWDKITFRTFSDEIQQTHISFPIRYEHLRFSISRALNLVYFESIGHYFVIPKRVDTLYSKYQIIIDKRYNKKSNEICLEDINISAYEFSNILLITKNVNLNTVKLVKNCSSK